MAEEAFVKKKVLLTRSMNKDIRKRIIKPVFGAYTVVWSGVIDSIERSLEAEM